MADVPMFPTLADTPQTIRTPTLPPGGLPVTAMNDADIPARYRVIPADPMVGKVGYAVRAWWENCNIHLPKRRGLCVIDTPSGPGLESLAVVFKRLLYAEGVDWPSGFAVWPPLWVDASQLDRDYKLRDQAAEAGLLIVVGVGMSTLGADLAASVLRTLAWQRFQEGKITLWHAVAMSGKPAKTVRMLLEMLTANSDVVGDLPNDDGTGDLA